MTDTVNSTNLLTTTQETHRTKPLVIAVIIAVLAGVATVAVTGALQPANASAGITTTADVNLRTGPGTGYDIIDVVPSGVSPNYLCYEQGENVSGVDVWFRVEWNGTTGFISSYYDSSSYPSDADIPGKYGINPCGSATLSDGSSDPFDREAAASWAYANATEPQDFAAGCTWFVSQALWAAGIPKSGDWTDDGSHGNWPWSRRPGTPAATAVQPFIDAFLGRFPASTVEQLDFSYNRVPDAEKGDLIAYDWDGDGSWDHLSIVTSIADGEYPNVAEWGTPDQWWGHPSMWYSERGWTWSAKNQRWLQEDHPNVRAMLIHIDTSHPSTY